MIEQKSSLGRIALYFVIYIVLVFLAELPGFLSPYYWVACGIVAAFLGAGPLTVCIHRTGSVLLIPIAVLLLDRLMGELGMDLMQIADLVLLTAAAVVCVLFKDNLKRLKRICVPIIVAMPSVNLLPLYFQTEAYGKAALDEMSPEYVSQMLGCAHVWVFVLVTVCVIAAGILSERLTEKYFCKE